MGMFHPLNWLYTAVLWGVIGLAGHAAFGRETYPGQYAQFSDRDRAWFKAVRSPRGVPCCDVADGHITSWRRGDKGYEVPIQGSWYVVPPEAVVENAFKPDDIEESVVWYVKQGAFVDENGESHTDYYIRCFVPGDGA